MPCGPDNATGLPVLMFASCCQQIGLLHEEGRGLARDWSAAEQWYLRAADSGNAHAMACMGNLLRRRSIVLSADTKLLEDATAAEIEAAGWWKRALKANPAVRDDVEELQVAANNANLNPKVLAKFAERDVAGAMKELVLDGSVEAKEMERMTQLMKLEGLWSKNGEKQTPFCPADLKVRSERQEKMLAAVQLKGESVMKECAAFLRAAGQFRLFMQLWSRCEQGPALCALYEALFQDEKAVLMCSEGPFSKVGLLVPGWS